MIQPKWSLAEAMEVLIALHRIKQAKGPDAVRDRAQEVLRIETVKYRNRHPSQVERYNAELKLREELSNGA